MNLTPLASVSLRLVRFVGQAKGTPLVSWRKILVPFALFCGHSCRCCVAHSSFVIVHAVVPNGSPTREGESPELTRLPSLKPIRAGALVVYVTRGKLAFDFVVFVCALPDVFQPANDFRPFFRRHRRAVFLVIR